MLTIGVLIIIFLLIIILRRIKHVDSADYFSDLDLIKSELSEIKENLFKDNVDADTDKSLEKTLENIADDLFLIKMELKLVRIDQLLGEFEGTIGNEEEEYNLRTRFQRLYYCMYRLKRYIYWEGDNSEGIEKETHKLKLQLTLNESEENELSGFVKDIVHDRNREIGSSIAWINDKKSATEYKKVALESFEKEKKELSRMEIVQRLNRIQWRCEVLNQMEHYFKENNSLKGWEYKNENIFSWGDTDERSILDY